MKLKGPIPGNSYSRSCVNFFIFLWLNCVIWVFWSTVNSRDVLYYCFKSPHASFPSFSPQEHQRMLDCCLAQYNTSSLWSERTIILGMIWSLSFAAMWHALKSRMWLRRKRRGRAFLRSHPTSPLHFHNPLWCVLQYWYQNLVYIKIAVKYNVSVTVDSVIGLKSYPMYSLTNSSSLLSLAIPNNEALLSFK